ncbi:unnamed protein product [Trifolium pratense]|uniref:Uncharacterized protein n=1 Tax=Trifolium pratense TaxID=57577 RepID=A0ACB0JAY3_TRIPR|nr:unnamed protein product [Trifolium pratense]
MGFKALRCSDSFTKHCFLSSFVSLDFQRSGFHFAVVSLARSDFQFAADLVFGVSENANMISTEEEDILHRSTRKDKLEGDKKTPRWLKLKAKLLNVFGEDIHDNLMHHGGNN